MKLRKKRGFTIVEMLMVIAVLAVLIGIVSTAASSVIRKARARKNEALRATLQAGIATYFQQEGFWPPGKTGKLQKWSANGLDAQYRNKGESTAPLSDADYDDLVSHLATRCLSASGNPVMDVSGFTVAVKSLAEKKNSDGNPVCRGEEVKSWVAKLKASNARNSAPKIDDVTFGYANSDKGYFRRFKIYYNSEADNVTVGYAKKQISPGNWDDDK